VDCYRLDPMGKTAGLTDPKALKQLPGLKPNSRRPQFVAPRGFYGYPFSVVHIQYANQSRTASSHTIKLSTRLKKIIRRFQNMVHANRS
jgi:hypothetical protein